MTGPPTFHSERSGSVEPAGGKTADPVTRVDRNGFVVGIVTGLVNPSPDDVFAGIGLAVPIDVAVAGVGMPPD